MKKTTKTDGKAPSVVVPVQQKNFSTTFSGNGFQISGEVVSKNFNTFWRMYEDNTDVFRCIEEKMQTCMKRGWELQKENTTDGKRKVAKDEAFKRALWDVDALKGMIIQALDIFADVFVRHRKNLRGQTIGYEVLDTREVSVVTDSLLNPIRYIYRRRTPQSIAVESYPAEQIDHWKTSTNWNNSIFGMTPMRTIVYDVLGDEQASMVNYYWYKNDAIPSSLYVLKEGLTPAEQEKAIADVQDTLKGAHNAGKSMVTNAVTKVEPVSANVKGIEDIEKRRYNTEKVCAALGVPRSILGYVEGVNLSNSGDMYKKFIENTIEPYERFLEKIFTKLSQEFNGYFFVINSDHIDQTEQRSKLWRENIAGGLWTINEAREEMGWERIDNELCDEILLPSTLQVIDNLLMGEPDIPDEAIPTPVVPA